MADEARPPAPALADRRDAGGRPWPASAALAGILTATAPQPPVGAAGSAPLGAAETARRSEAAPIR